MGWERRRTGTYYYRSRKVGGRVIKEYVGTGPRADSAAARDATARAHRAVVTAARRDARAELDAIDAPIDHFTATVESLTRAGLLLAGYYRHHGGDWRRRRDG